MNLRERFRKEWPAIAGVAIVIATFIAFYCYRGDEAAIFRIYNLSIALIAFPMIMYRGEHPIIFASFAAIAGIVGAVI